MNFTSADLSFYWLYVFFSKVLMKPTSGLEWKYVIIISRRKLWTINIKVGIWRGVGRVIRRKRGSVVRCDPCAIFLPWPDRWIWTFRLYPYRPYLCLREPRSTYTFSKKYYLAVRFIKLYTILITRSKYLNPA